MRVSRLKISQDWTVSGLEPSVSSVDKTQQNQKVYLSNEGKMHSSLGLVLTF